MSLIGQFWENSRGQDEMERDRHDVIGDAITTGLATGQVKFFIVSPIK